MSLVDQATIGQAWATGVALLIIGGIVVISGGFAPMLSLKDPGRKWIGISVASILIVLGGAIFVVGDQAAGSASESIAKNVAAKYDTVGTIKLIPRFDSNSRGIKRIDLADGRAIISGTITIAESGEPTIIDPVYAAAGDSVPVRKEVIAP